MTEWLLAGASVMGPGHYSDGTPNQDAFLTQKLNRGFLLVVCDGMGSKRLSHIGSVMACRAVQDVISKESFYIDSRTLVESIYRRWLQLVGDRSVTEAVTTCLFCWCDDNGNARSFQLGDGLILAKKLPLPDPTSDFGNVTTGLGVSKKYSDWFINEFTLEVADGVVLMTDGISEDLHQGSEQQLLSALTFDLQNKNPRRIKKYLTKELMAWPTPNHLDDKTIAIAINR